MDYAIVADKITKTYGTVTAVDEVSIRVEPGATFGLLGANGAGKSTLVECILGVRKANAGSSAILQMNPIKERTRLFEQVSVQFQEARYQDKIKVDELCRITAALYKESEDYRILLSLFGLKDKQQQFVSNLSGGEKQKLFIVLALIPKPRVVFLDELTTGLDVKARREVWRHLSSLKEQGITLFMTTHFMDEVEALCDRIAIMQRGRLVFEGAVQEAIDSAECTCLEDAYLFYAEEEDYESL